MLWAADDPDTCWWCRGAPADSREHKLKRSDLVRQFGAGPYPELVSEREGRLRRMQGPNSTLANTRYSDAGGELVESVEFELKGNTGTVSLHKISDGPIHVRYRPPDSLE